MQQRWVGGGATGTQPWLSPTPTIPPGGVSAAAISLAAAAPRHGMVGAHRQTNITMQHLFAAAAP